MKFILRIIIAACALYDLLCALHICYSEKEVFLEYIKNLKNYSIKEIMQYKPLKGLFFGVIGDLLVLVYVYIT